MHFSGLFKQLKRRLRWKRRWLSLGVWILLVGFVCSAVWLWQPSETRNANILLNDDAMEKESKAAINMDYLLTEPNHQQIVLERIKGVSGKSRVFFQKNYVCGEEIKQLGQMSAKEILQLHEKNPQWSVSLSQDGRVFFVENIEDLSPHCKETAYFGLDKNGNLSLFDGLPKKENVMRTFFQLNIHHLESSLPRQTIAELREGIRVSDLAEYNSVLSTFSEFAIEEIKK